MIPRLFSAMAAWDSNGHMKNEQHVFVSRHASTTGDVRSSVVIESEIKCEDPGFDLPGGGGAQTVSCCLSGSILVQACL